MNIKKLYKIQLEVIPNTAPLTEVQKKLSRWASGTYFIEADSLEEAVTKASIGLKMSSVEFFGILLENEVQKALAS